MLTRRDSRNSTGEYQNHDHSKERVKNHRDGGAYRDGETYRVGEAYRDGETHTDGETHRYGESRNKTESQAAGNQSFHQETSTTKNYTEHLQALPVVKKANHTEQADHSKPQNLANLKSDHPSKDANPAGTRSDLSPSNSTASLLSSPSNSSEPPSISTSNTQTVYISEKKPGNLTENNTYTWGSGANISSATSFTNSSSLEPFQLVTAGNHSRDIQHHKIKVCCITVGSLIALACIGTVLVFAKKRLKLKAPVAFFRRHFRFKSNNNNQAVGARSSIWPPIRASDPHSAPSTFSRKPLILRPDSISYIRSSSSQRHSLRHLRHESIKSQISPPIIELPPPSHYHPLRGGSPDKTRRVVPAKENQLSSRFNGSPPCYHQPEECHSSSSKHRSRITLTQDPGVCSQSHLPMKAPEISSRLGEADSESFTERTPVPPRPARPDFLFLGPKSRETSGLSKPIGETEPVFPPILPLKVYRRSAYTDKHNRRHNSIDQVMLDPPASYTFQDSPTLPQFQRDERTSVHSMERKDDPTRTSHLSRSTCYSQSSEQENFSVPEENWDPDFRHQTHMRLMSFGPSRNSTKLEQQLDTFISKNI